MKSDPSLKFLLRMRSLCASARPCGWRTHPFVRDSSFRPVLPHNRRNYEIHPCIKELSSALLRWRIKNSRGNILALRKININTNAWIAIWIMLLERIEIEIGKLKVNIIRRSKMSNTKNICVCDVRIETHITVIFFFISHVHKSDWWDWCWMAARDETRVWLRYLIESAYSFPRTRTRQ